MDAPTGEVAVFQAPRGLAPAPPSGHPWSRSGVWYSCHSRKNGHALRRLFCVGVLGGLGKLSRRGLRFVGKPLN